MLSYFRALTRTEWRVLFLAQVVQDAVAFPSCFGYCDFLFHFDVACAIIGSHELHLGIDWADSTSASGFLGNVFTFPSCWKTICYVGVLFTQRLISWAAFADALWLKHPESFLHLFRRNSLRRRHFEQPRNPYGNYTLKCM